MNDQRVHVGELVALARDVLLDEVVLPLVGEDDMNPLGRGAAHIRAEHDVVI